MSLRRTVNPVNLPVEIADARKQCEIGENDDAHDSHIIRLIRTATADVERGTRRALITQTWKLSLEEFPEEIAIPRPPLQSLELRYKNDSNVLTLLASTEYQIEYGTPACVEVAYGKSWPVIYPETVDAVQVTFVAGFGDNASDIPSEYQNLILELVAFRFFNRGDVEAEIPRHIQWAMKSLHCGAKLGYYDVQ